MRVVRLALVVGACGAADSNALRQEQAAGLQAAFSRYGSQGLGKGGAIERNELPSFLQFVVASMGSRAQPKEQAIAARVPVIDALAGDS